MISRINSILTTNNRTQKAPSFNGKITITCEDLNLAKKTPAEFKTFCENFTELIGKTVCKRKATAKDLSEENKGKFEIRVRNKYNKIVEDYSYLFEKSFEELGMGIKFEA